MSDGRRPGYQRRRKELRYLKQQPGFTSRPSNADVKEHIRYLLSYGWTLSDIDAKAGTGKGVAHDQLTLREHCFEDTAAAILGVKLTDFDLRYGPGLTAYGRKLGAHRIVTGLTASGWSGPAITAMSPGWGPDCVRRYAQTPREGARSHISKERYIELRELAQRLEMLDPIEDGGSDPTSSRAARSKARTRGYPPIHCWDLETVHLPESFPEWTGACGTEEGYRIHIRETFFKGAQMPPCARCRAVVEVGDPAARKQYPLNLEHLRQAIADSPLTGAQIGEGIYGKGGAKAGRDILYRWRDGSRQPRSLGMVEKLAATLDVDTDYLLDRQEIEAQDSAPRFKPGDFNPFVVRAALDMAGLSYYKASLLPGCRVSKAAINSWASGASSPHRPEKVQFLADHFGVDVKIFYF